ncbi:MAG: J domain-containing protein, partial [Kofleriaceae bacterium]
MFLKASSQPPLGTPVRIDLELPSATVLELSGTISEHVTDPQRGTGVLLALEPLPTKTVWLIESALAAENKVRAQTAQPRAATSDSAPGDSQVAMIEGENIAEAEADLRRALDAEAEALRKLNPFLVLGVGYETTDADVRAAFGELTKRYHPDRFARYQSTKLRQIAAEIFIVIRDAYRKLADQQSRHQVRATVGARVATPPLGVR